MLRIFSTEKPELSPIDMPDRFRMEIVFFMSDPDLPGIPPMGENEFWIDLDSAKRWLDEFVILVVSPLDAESKAEIELTDYQEEFLEWLVSNEIQRVRAERV